MRSACRGRAGRLALSGTPYRNIGRVVKARGLEGKVLVQVTQGLPFCIYEGLKVSIVPPLLDIERSGEVLECDSVSDDSCVVSLSNISNVDDAEAVAGHYLLALEDDLDLDPAQDAVLVVGRNVVSDDGRALGKVSEYLCTKANDVLVITRQDETELLVPVIEQTIVSVPQEEDAPIVVHLLEGLEEL